MMTDGSAIPIGVRAVIAALAGVLATFAFAPFNAWWLIFVPPAALYWLLNGSSRRQQLTISYIFGLGFYGGGVSWVYVSINSFGNTGMIGAGALTAVFVAGLALMMLLQGWCYSRWFSGKRLDWLGFIAIWVLFEWVRSWLLTGFPWLYVGYPLLETPIKAWAPVGGIWALSLAALFLSIGLLKLLLIQNVKQRLPYALMMFIALAGMALPKQWTEQGEALTVSIVQANISQHIKWNKLYLPETLQQYSDLTGKAPAADLVLWPETAIPTVFARAAVQLSPVLNQLESQGSTLISGLPFVGAAKDDGHRNVHNSLAVLTQGHGIYHKQRLVPFGEYIPLDSWLRGVIAFFNLPMSSFTLPEQSQQLLSVGDLQLAPAICYEIAYPELVRKSSIESDLLLTVSNDTWFGRSIAPDQHMQIARMRALETGRWLIRGTNNGISALVNPQGEIISQAERYQADVLHDTVYQMTGLTPYQKVGSWPVLAFATLLLVAALAAGGNFRSTRSSVQKCDSDIDDKAE